MNLIEQRRLVNQKRLVWACRVLRPRVGLVHGVKEDGKPSAAWNETIGRYQKRRGLRLTYSFDRATRADILKVIGASVPPPDAAWRPPTFGIDVSNNNGTVDWGAVGKSRVVAPQVGVNVSVRFAYAKVTEGHTYVDRYWPENRAGAQKAGVLVGGYAFYRAGDAAGQTRHFIDNLGQHAGMLVPAIDWEYQGSERDLDALETAVDLLHREVGQYPVVYGNYWNLGASDWPADSLVGKCPLWLAGYGSNDGKFHGLPNVPRPWAGRPHPIAIHQYSSNGLYVSAVKGIASSFLDVNAAYVNLGTLIDREG